MSSITPNKTRSKMRSAIKGGFFCLNCQEIRPFKIVWTGGDLKHCSKCGKNIFDNQTIDLTAKRP